jgi:hypothetical protein
MLNFVEQSFYICYRSRMLKWFRMHHYWHILIAQVVLLFLSAFLRHHFIISVLFVLCLLGIFGAVIENIWTRRLPRVLALISGVAAAAGGLLQYIHNLSQLEYYWGLFICCIAYAVFIVIAIISIARYVFITDRITQDRIIGSICIYMLIGMLFAFIYAAMGIIINGGFEMAAKMGNVENVYFADFLYFSYSTLTTIGFGDVTPTHPVTKMTACLEGVTGCVYLAIMVARLVGMHVTQSRSKEA